MKDNTGSNHYDVIIIGAGLGGLLCAAILAKEGRKVCVLEKNRQIGGCLQTFAFHKKVFDSCVHYIGGLGEGHTLHKIFRYAGIMDALQLSPLDAAGFDRIAFEDEQIAYPHAIGEQAFIARLLHHFPEESEALKKYIALVNEVCDRFPLYHLRAGSAEGKAAVASLGLLEVLEEITADKRLQAVLAGSSMLYAGAAGKTPFYLHALVTSSYIHSAHKVLPGSSAIAKELRRVLQDHGGLIVRRAAVTELQERDGCLATAIAGDGTAYTADHFIAAVHPAALMRMMTGDGMRPAYRKRMSGLPDTPPGIILNVVLKKEKIRHRAHNIYWHPDGRVLADSEGWPGTLAFFFSEDKTSPGFAESVSVMSYAKWEDWKSWEDSSQTKGVGTSRTAGYAAFKQAYSNRLLRQAAGFLPELAGNIEAHVLATPLTFRDYTGTPTGALYGVMKDVTSPAAGTVPVRTRIPNLLLTGQNVNMHGVLGVSITAVATCAELLGMDYLLKKINTV